MKSPFQAGDRVKPSEYRLRPARDAWLKAGNESLKSICRDAYDKQIAIRGTVLSCEMGECAFAVTVKTDAGAIYQSMTDMWETIA